MSEQPPLHREVLVDADPQTAFEVFTAAIGRWWPVDDLSVFGAGSSVRFAGSGADSRIEEVSASGEVSVWGSVTRWGPPTVLGFTWHPGRDPERAGRVEVTFTRAGEQTLVVLEHSGWEVYDDPAAARREYGSGWPTVLTLFQVQVATGQTAADAEEGDTWVALLHRPGPAAPRDSSLFEDSRIQEHFAFLQRMQQLGYLVAAGPLTDEDGSGMTVLRLPGPGRLEKATHLATQDDASVAGGFLSVAVRPWRVMLHNGDQG